MAAAGRLPDHDPSPITVVRRLHPPDPNRASRLQGITMNAHVSSRVVLIQTRPGFSASCAQLMQDSVRRARSIEGCVDCQLQAHQPDPGRWTIRGAWSSEDSMLASLVQVFQPAFDNLIASNTLLSIRISEEDF